MTETAIVDPESTRTVTVARMNALADYVAVCQTVLGLDEWKTTLKWDKRPGDSDAMAEIRPTTGRAIAHLFIDEDFFSEDPKDQRVIVAHELSHLIVDPLDIVIWRGNLDAVLGVPAMKLFSGMAHAAMERVVDRIAFLVAELLPLPGMDAEPKRAT